LQKNRNYAIHFFADRIEPGCGAPTARRMRGGMRLRHSAYNLNGRCDFFIFLGRNPLKSPDSAKEIQGNARNFPWIYLELLAFICMDVAFRL
jgi:hypothetical protein